MNLLRLLIFWIIFVFLCFPSNAYDEKIKLNRTDNKIISGKTKIKINLNNMLNFRKLKQINKYYASIEHSVKKTSEELREGDRPIFRGVFSDNVKATVYMEHNNRKGMGAGSIIKRNGKLLVLTNWHVIDRAKKLNVWLLPEDTTKKEIYNLWDTEPHFIGEVIKTNKKKDLALVKVEGFPKDTEVITLGSIRDIKIGETVHAIGHPEGSTWSFNTGYINQIRPDHRWRYENSRHKADVIQHQIPISPGNSGGPLLNKFGKLIGINSYSHEDGQNLNFAIAISDIIEFLEQEQVVDKPTCTDNNVYITKKCKGKTWITKKCKDKISYITKKCKDKKMSTNGKDIMKTYPNALSSDANNNEIDDTWYVDTNNNGKIDTAFIDDDEDGIIEAVMLDDNENNIWEIIIGDKDLDGNPDVAIIDRDEDGKGDVIAYDYDQDGEWDKFEQAS